eukprot:COSAG06_NODE_6687_length_2824_cov_31.220917_3_plen_75_part_00
MAPSNKTKTKKKKKNETKLKKDEWMIDWEKVRAKKCHLYIDIIHKCKTMMMFNDVSVHFSSIYQDRLGTNGGKR